MALVRRPACLDEHARVRLFQLAKDPVPVVRVRLMQRGGAHAVPKGHVGEQPLSGERHRLRRVALIARALGHQAAGAAGVGGHNDRHAAGHGLKHRRAKRLGTAGHQVRVRVGVRGPELGAGHGAHEDRFGHLARQSHAGGPVANHHHGEAHAARSQHGVYSCHVLETFFPHHAACHEQHGRRLELFGQRRYRQGVRPRGGCRQGRLGRVNQPADPRRRCVAHQRHCARRDTRDGRRAADQLLGRRLSLARGAAHEGCAVRAERRRRLLGSNRRREHLTPPTPRVAAPWRELRRVNAAPPRQRLAQREAVLLEVDANLRRGHVHLLAAVVKGTHVRPQRPLENAKVVVLDIRSKVSVVGAHDWHLALDGPRLRLGAQQVGRGHVHNGGRERRQPRAALHAKPKRHAILGAEGRLHAGHRLNLRRRQRLGGEWANGCGGTEDKHLVALRLQPPCEAVQCHRHAIDDVLISAREDRHTLPAWQHRRRR
mmetsp:Transcript_7988/g.24565  ORF Transcript_7988/g.24565 Transcript_7988/m.24565 type:complete len:486 (+) Transcript_7988:1125-2582(+)